jgi:hypothetical protein
MSVEKKCVNFPVCVETQWAVTCVIALMDTDCEEERIQADV